MTLYLQIQHSLQDLSDLQQSAPGHAGLRVPTHTHTQQSVIVNELL